MKRSSFLMFALAWFFVGIGPSLAADPPKDDAVQKEMARFNGTWRFVSVEAEGTKVPEEEVKQGTMVLKDGKFTVKQGDMTHQGTFKVDLSKKPKQIDMTVTDGPDKGNTYSGIYELEGDTYKICGGIPGKERPTEFVTKPGSGHSLHIMKREKP